MNGCVKLASFPKAKLSALALNVLISRPIAIITIHEKINLTVK